MYHDVTTSHSLDSKNGGEIVWTIREKFCLGKTNLFSFGFYCLAIIIKQIYKESY